MQKINRRNVLAGSLVAYAATNLNLSNANAATETATKHTVIIKSFKFQPNHITVRVGDMIEWVNQDLAPHTATAYAGDWDTHTLEKGQSKTLVVTEEMTGDYFCLFHPNMKAKLKIR